jgi:hypothetical protein
MSNGSTRLALAALLAASFSVVGSAPIAVSAATSTSVGSSTEARAFQHSAADKVAYLHDGSLLVGYYDPTGPGQGIIKHVTNPTSATPTSTQVDTITAGSEVTFYTLPSTNSTEIWIGIGSELTGGTQQEQVQYGTYDGSSFTWSAVTTVPGSLTSGRQDPTITWTGTYLITSWWDDTLGGNTDTVFYNWTATKDGTSGWNVVAKSGTTATAAAIKSGTSSPATLAGATSNDYNLTSGAAPVASDVFEFGKGTANSDVRSVSAVVQKTGNIAAPTNPSDTSITYTVTTGGAPAIGDVFTFGTDVRTVSAVSVVASTYTLTVAALVSAHAMGDPATGPYTLTVGSLTHVHAAGETVTTAASSAGATSITYNLSSGDVPLTNDMFQIGTAISNDGTVTCGTVTTPACDADFSQATVTGTGPYTLTFASGLSHGHAVGEPIRIAASQLTPTKPNSVQVAIRHSSKLGATIAVYGAYCKIYSRTLLDSKSPLPANWTAQSAFDLGDDCENNFGGPQIAIDEANGNIHVFKAITNWNGATTPGIAYWLGTPDGAPMVSGIVSWSSRLVIDPTTTAGGPTYCAAQCNPPDIAGAVDANGRVYVYWATNITGGAIKFATLDSPYTTPSAIGTVATTGSDPHYPHVPGLAPLTRGYVPLFYESGSGTYNIMLTALDTMPPTVPTGLTGTSTTKPSVILNWTASTDTIDGVSGYSIYRADHGSVPLATVSGTTLTYTDSTVVQLTSYSFTVDAFDAAGNHSAQSAAAIVNTPDSSPPSVPTGLTATFVASTPQVNLAWNASTDNVAVTGYTIYRNGSVLTTVSGSTLTYADTAITVSATYVYTVDAFDAAGNHSAQSASAAVNPGVYTAMPPKRLLDTRNTGSKLGPGGSMNLVIADTNGVPANASAVILNVTAVDETTAGFFTVYPTGATLPTASNLNWVAGETVPNLVSVGLGAGGKVTIYNGLGMADAVVDLEGYFAPSAGGTAGQFVPVVPARITDTRASSGQPNHGLTLIGGTTLNVQVTGVGGIPANGVTAVVLNTTVTDTTSAGFLTVFPTGAGLPVASNLNWMAGVTVPNRVIVPVGTGGKVSFYNGLGSADLIVDVNGYFTDSTGTGASFVPLTPSRIVDTRMGGAAPLGPSATMTVTVAGNGGVPATGAKAVVLNVTVVNPTGASALTVWPSDAVGRPLASDLNFTAGQTVPNLVVVKLSANGQIDIFNAFGTTNVIVDVVGWYG